MIAGFRAWGCWPGCRWRAGHPREVLSAVISADWSPDGKDLAAGVWGSVQYPIGKVLYEAASSGFVSSLRVSPDGNHVAFLDHPSRDSERGILSVVDRAGRKRVLTNEWAKAGPILWSPAGDEVFFTRWGSNERRGARLSGGTRSAAWVPGLDDVSRAGLFLDTGMLSENYRGIIRARVPDAREERNLSWLGRSVAADLSTDGNHLLLYEEGSNPERQEEVFTTYLRPTDGSDATRLGEGRALALSPDLQWALVARAAPETHLVLLPLGEGEPQRLPGGGLLYRRASLFPRRAADPVQRRRQEGNRIAPTSRTSREAPRGRSARMACWGRSFRRTGAPSPW